MEKELKHQIAESEFVTNYSRSKARKLAAKPEVDEASAKSVKPKKRKKN